MNRPATPRLEPIRIDEASAEARALLDPVLSSGWAAINVFATLVRHPRLFRRMGPFGAELRLGRLPPADRELLILRTAWNCGSAYEWEHHRLVGKQVGLSEEHLDDVRSREFKAVDPFQAALLAAADELHRDACITDATWALLTERYDDEQLIEVPLVVGHYHMIAFALNSLGVPLEPDILGKRSDQSGATGQAEREAAG